VESDAQTLRRFVVSRDEAAFATLVDRYGRMVLTVCRRVLGNNHAAEDAFQATFLVLARKAGWISKRSSLASWLWRVAYRIALRARQTSGTIRLQPLPDEDIHARGLDDPAELVAQRELGLVVLEEIQRLPEKCRAPFILCVLEDRDYRTVAAELRRPLGTVSAQVTRAKELLRKRLQRRGWTLPTGFIGFWFASSAPASVPHTLVSAVNKLSVGTHGVASGAPEAVVVLAKGVMRDMTMSKVQWACVALVTVAATGLWGVSHLQSQPVPLPPAVYVPQDVIPAATASPATFAPAFQGKALRVELKGLKEILVDPEVKMLGTRTFIVGERVSREGGGKLWIPIEDVVSIGEFKDLNDLKKYWKIEY
jgi:RNA polymerase sigma factor (sigma-70 family)